MKSDLLIRGRLLVALAAMLFCGMVYPQDALLEPTWVRPDTNFSQYNSFLVTSLDVSDMKLIRPPCLHGGLF